MAQIKYRGNLTAKAFPLLSTNFGRSVIIPGSDQNVTPRTPQATQDDLQTDRGIPQIYYAQNAMPTAEGIQSIGYQQQVSIQSSGFINIYVLIDSTGTKVYFSHKADGTSWVLTIGGINWVQTTFVAASAGKQVSIATLQGQTYIYFATVGCYIYDVGSNTLIPIVLTGITLATTLGIVNSSGYMLVWSSSAIAWCSTIARALITDPIDFVPSLVTGAGGGNVESARGKITYCISHYLGVIIYTTDNAIAAIFSNNARYPFNFREIVGAGGLSDPSLISSEAQGGAHYAYTTSGLQLVNISQGTSVLPEITDFLAGEYYEDFDDVTISLSYIQLSAPMVKQINYVSDRYLLVSYGVGSLAQTIVLDTKYNRLGKLKLPHTATFEFKNNIPETTDLPRKSIAFLQDSGMVFTVNFAIQAGFNRGVIFLGKYQVSRTRFTTLDEVEFENIFIADTAHADKFRVWDAYSLDGKTTTLKEGYLSYHSPNISKYTWRVTGVNHTLIVMGNFNLNSIMLSLHVNGRR